MSNRTELNLTSSATGVCLVWINPYSIASPAVTGINPSTMNASSATNFVNVSPGPSFFSGSPSVGPLAAGTYLPGPYAPQIPNIQSFAVDGLRVSFMSTMSPLNISGFCVTGVYY